MAAGSGESGRGVHGEFPGSKGRLHAGDLAIWVVFHCPEGAEVVEEDPSR
jgi:hypothetical protein